MMQNSPAILRDRCCAAASLGHSDRV